MGEGDDLSSRILEGIVDEAVAEEAKEEAKDWCQKKQKPATSRREMQNRPNL